MTRAVSPQHILRLKTRTLSTIGKFIRQGRRTEQTYGLLQLKSSLISMVR
jgi:hypothetical protein